MGCAPSTSSNAHDSTTAVVPTASASRGAEQTLLEAKKHHPNTTLSPQASNIDSSVPASSTATEVGISVPPPIAIDSQKSEEDSKSTHGDDMGSIPQTPIHIPEEPIEEEDTLSSISSSFTSTTARSAIVESSMNTQEGESGLRRSESGGPVVIFPSTSSGDYDKNGSFGADVTIIPFAAQARDGSASLSPAQLKEQEAALALHTCINGDASISTTSMMLVGSGGAGSSAAIEWMYQLPPEDHLQKSESQSHVLSRQLQQVCSESHGSSENLS